MVQSMKVSTNMDRKTAKAVSSGLMEATTMVSSKTTTFKVMDVTLGVMAGISSVPGSTTKWKETERSLGLMVENIKVVT